ncbi:MULTISPECIES: SSI family serine proteinase inhibitor [Streptomyces]
MAAVVLTATPAAAGNCSVADLRISVSHAGINPRPSGERTDTLKCFPPGGTHAKPIAACDKLRQIDGDLDRLKSSTGNTGVVCTLQYEPVKVQIEGKLKNKKVHWTYTYGNPCLMRQAADNLFLLPPGFSCPGQEEHESRAVSPSGRGPHFFPSGPPHPGSSPNTVIPE